MDNVWPFFDFEANNFCKEIFFFFFCEKLLIEAISRLFIFSKPARSGLMAWWCSGGPNGMPLRAPFKSIFDSLCRNACRSMEASRPKWTGSGSRCEPRPFVAGNWYFPHRVASTAEFDCKNDPFLSGNLGVFGNLGFGFRSLWRFQRNHYKISSIERLVWRMEQVNDIPDYGIERCF